MKPSEILEAALAKFGPNGEHWNQGSFARDREGEPTYYRSSDACRWCPAGALSAVCGVDQSEVPEALRLAEKYLQTVCKPLVRREQGSALVIFNDVAGRRFEEVKEVFQKAIARARKAEQAA